MGCISAPPPHELRTAVTIVHEFDLLANEIVEGEPHSAWIKIRNPASIAMQRERSEGWNK
jgi:hypothetical protein